MPSIGFTDKCGVERNRALPAITIGPSTQLHPRSTKRGNEGSRLVRCKARDGYCVGSEPQTLRTEARSAGNKNAARREKGDTMETQWAQRVDDWATWTSGREIASLSSALLQLAAAVYQPPRCNLIRALSHERTESALQAGPLLPSTPPLFPPSTFPLAPLFLPSTSSGCYRGTGRYVLSDKWLKI